MTLPPEGSVVQAKIYSRETDKFLRIADGIYRNGAIYEFGVGEDGTMDWTVYVGAYRIRRPDALQAMIDRAAALDIKPRVDA